MAKSRPHNAKGAKKNNGVSVQRRTAMFITGLLLVLIVLLGRIGWMQFVEGKHLTDQGNTQLVEKRNFQSPRGTIYDRNGRELAVSSMTKSLYADTVEFNQDLDTIANSIAPILEMNAGEIKELLLPGGRFIWIKRTLEPEVAQQITALNIRGLAFVEESKRYYPNETLAAHVLGFVGTDDVGLNGLEMTLDNVIKGELSKQAVETDSRGKPIFKSIFTFVPPKQVKNVHLTLDSTIQFIVEQSLDKAMLQTGAGAITIVLMNPRNGEILAMGSRPTYNPNKFYQYSEKEWKNRAVSSIYEPGSTFKSIVAGAALQEGVVTANERFIDQGYVEVSGRRIKNWSNESYGNISFVDIIKNSINTGFVQIGLRLGGAKLNDYARAFGFGKITGIEMPGEEEGIMFKTDEMRQSDIATMSIGQSIAVTPLQLLAAVSAIANDGILLKPHIIKEIYNADGTIFSAKPVETIRQVITPETAHTLTMLLEKVISEGGGRKAAVQGYRFAGKTGTAERLLEGGGGYEEGHYIASFVGFGPVEEPQVAILVMIDDPAGARYYGGDIAAPVASEILTQVMRYLNIHPQAVTVMPPVKNEVNAGGGNASPLTAVPPPATKPKVVVPNVAGKTIKEVGEIFGQIGLGLIPSGTGTAVSQSIEPNTIVNYGDEVNVNFQMR